MSYFDHVRCHACKAMLDPESLGGRGGGGLVCPKCGAALSLTDLFGLASAFAEEEEPDMSLDDLVPNKPAAPRPAAAPPAARPAVSPPPKGAPRAPSGGNALVHKPSRDDDEQPPKGGALEAMRALKKKR